MLNQSDIERLEHYISGIADVKEEAYVEALFSEGLENFDLQNYLGKDWKNYLQKTTISEADLSRILDRVHHLIQNKENQKKKRFIHRLTDIYSRVAAVLLLPLIIAGGLLFSHWNQPTIPVVDRKVSSVIHAPLGSRVSFNLPDGTTGWLNSGSSLTYSLPFSNNRKIELEGEAWFGVMKDEANPFEINVGNSMVKVLGTSFNVSAYRGENYVEVVLQQGKVEFYRDNLAEKVTLSPSQKLVLRDGKVNLSVTDPLKYKAWTDGKLVFRGDDMAEVARRIERWYNVTVLLADKDLEKFSFRATFEDDSLDEVLRLLSLTSPIGYKITPRVLKIDGSFEKEIVTLYKKTNKN